MTTGAIAIAESANVDRSRVSGSLLAVPRDETQYPTLGPLVVEWMEHSLVFGPGDLRGEPLVLDDEQRGFIFRFYEVMPPEHKNAGRRRFRRCALSLAKGLRKTELAAFVAAAELAGDAPIRFDGWDEDGQPKGKPVRDPFVVLVAYTEEQSDELCYGALRAILAESPICAQFDIGMERIVRRTGEGKAVSLAGSPSARDGARTTFQCFDETHWHTSDKLHLAHQVMLANLPKRRIAEPWALEVTTAFEPGSGSIAEDTMDYARAVHEGRTKDAQLFFYHRQASDAHDLGTLEGVRSAILEASGPASSWRDIDGIVDMFQDPTSDLKWLERVWCNRPVQSTRKAFDVELFRSLKREDVTVADGSTIALGFDGAQFHDATALVATDLKTAHQWVVGAWECPPGADGINWRVPEAEVDAAVSMCFERFNVWRMYADPPYWQSWLSTWEGRYGVDRVIRWDTNRRKQMAAALESYETAMHERKFTHSGDDLLVRHVANAHRHELPHRNEEARPQWLIRKERSNSPYKIDAAMASCLSWECYSDAIASGVAVSGIFERAWLKFWTVKPTGGNRYVLVRGPIEKPEKDKSPYTAAVVVELRSDKTYVVLEFVRDRLELAERADLLFRLHRDYAPLRVGYTKRAHELDAAHLRERQERENYRFSIQELDEATATGIERAKRLEPLLRAGRVVLPEKQMARLRDASTVNMTDLFVRTEYEPFPQGLRVELLDALSCVLDVHAVFPTPVAYQHPSVFPSDWE